METMQKKNVTAFPSAANHSPHFWSMAVAQFDDTAITKLPVDSQSASLLPQAMG
jgi:hypothetical protein